MKLKVSAITRNYKNLEEKFGWFLVVPKSWDKVVISVTGTKDPDDVEDIRKEVFKYFGTREFDAYPLSEKLCREKVVYYYKTNTSDLVVNENFGRYSADDLVYRTIIKGNDIHVTRCRPIVPLRLIPDVILVYTKLDDKDGIVKFKSFSKRYKQALVNYGLDMVMD